MNYKETLYFIAKSLTICLEEKNRDEIELILKTTDVDWDEVVKVSTANYVLPALYCNLKRADFLQYLPQDLVIYMDYDTKINRERNEQIITQAQELNTLLLANNITPIFLKGIGNLLAELYDDVAERMVGDIDFLFSKEEFPKPIEVLKNNDYSFTTKIPFEYQFKHYPRLTKKDRIAAIEIHKEIILIKYAKEFNYSFVEKDSQVINDITVLSYANKLNLSIISNQINDHGFYYKAMPLEMPMMFFYYLKKQTQTMR